MSAKLYTWQSYTSSALGRDRRFTRSSRPAAIAGAGAAAQVFTAGQVEQLARSSSWPGRAAGQVEQLARSSSRPGRAAGQVEPARSSRPGRFLAKEAPIIALLWVSSFVRSPYSGFCGDFFAALDAGMDKVYHSGNRNNPSKRGNDGQEHNLLHAGRSSQAATSHARGRTNLVPRRSTPGDPRRSQMADHR